MRRPRNPPTHFPVSVAARFERLRHWTRVPCLGRLALGAFAPAVQEAGGAREAACTHVNPKPRSSQLDAVHDEGSHTWEEF